MRWLFLALPCLAPAIAQADEAAAYQQAVTSVVGITTTTDAHVRTGTGVVLAVTELTIERKTYRWCTVVTAEHVVAKGGIEVLFPRRDENGDVIGRREAYVGKPAAIIGTDHARDLALLRVMDPEGVKPIKTARRADPGEQVFTIGAGSGTLWHFASGNVRQIHHGMYKTGDMEVDARLIEMTIPVNPGDSGGPIIDKEGALIGITLFTATTSNQVHFGVHISEIQAFRIEALAGKKR